MTQQKGGAPTELGTAPISKLLLQFSIPAIIAMLASSLYNIVDSVFIGQGVGALAISGLAITFPLMNLSAAFGAMVGVGASTLISVKLGQKDYATAQHILGNTVTLNIIMGVLFGGICLLLLHPILMFFGASDATYPYAAEYMRIILIGNVITHSYMGLNCVLRSAGHPRTAMACTMVTVVVNAVLDPLFIYTFNMGIAGAAWATVLAQMLSLVWQIYIFSNKGECLHFKKGIYALKRNIVENTVSIGLSPFFMNACACLVVVFVNKGLAQYGGDLAIGAYGIVNRIVFVFVMIVIGLNQGTQPIIGYNYGAKQMDRMLKTVRIACIAATCITTSGFLIGWLCPTPVVELFTHDKELIRLSVEGFHLTVLVFPLIGFQMVTTNFFQSIGYAKISILLSLTRQLIFLLPLLIVLPKFFELQGVWYAMPASDFLASIMTFFVLMAYLKKLKQAHELE